jgi:thymidine kinase
MEESAKDKTRIEVILGCMFSGKSTELIRRTNRYKSIGKRILLINHVLDERTDDSIQAHCGRKVSAIKTDKLYNLREIVDSYDVIGIDEAQFFPDLLRFVTEIEKLGKVIVVAGLDGDYKREPIGQILFLIPLCDEVVKLTAMDKDGSPAIFTKRTSIFNEQILVGASESYIAVSRKHF